MNLRVALRLGRVSNLPTVWTNVLAGAALSGAEPVAAVIAAVLVAMSLFYVAGMFLNDAFDREIDAIERPERPIPAGEVTARAVFTAGFAMMALGLALLVAAGYVLEGGTGWRSPVAAIALGAAIVLYNSHHKSNPLSPLLMGVCRMLVYLTAGLAVTAAVPGALVAAAVVAVGYLIGLTYVAKQENLTEFKGVWPVLFLAAPFVYLAPRALEDPAMGVIFVGFAAWVIYALSFLFRRQRVIPRAVISLIAGISLLDALLAGSVGQPGLAWGCVAAFGTTLVLQRWVAGT